MKKIQKINEVIEMYFNQNDSRIAVMAKDLMPNFIEHGIFKKDNKEGKPIRDKLRDLDDRNELQKIPSTFPIRKNKNTNWFFVNLKKVLRDAEFRN